MAGSGRVTRSGSSRSSVFGGVWHAERDRKSFRARARPRHSGLPGWAQGPGWHRESRELPGSSIVRSPADSPGRSSRHVRPGKPLGHAVLLCCRFADRCPSWTLRGPHCRRTHAPKLRNRTCPTWLKRDESRSDRSAGLEGPGTGPVLRCHSMEVGENQWSFCEVAA
jgi:hypothetical protein